MQIYPAEDVPERNATYEVVKYSPGYFVIGTVNDFRVLLRAGKSSPVFENDWGAMSLKIMKNWPQAWKRGSPPGRPDSSGEPAAD